MRPVSAGLEADEAVVASPFRPVTEHRTARLDWRVRSRRAGPTVGAACREEQRQLPKRRCLARKAPVPPGQAGETTYQSVIRHQEERSERDLAHQCGDDALALIAAPPREDDVEPCVAEEQCRGDEEGGDHRLTVSPSEPCSGRERKDEGHVEPNPGHPPLVRSVLIWQRDRQHRKPWHEHHGSRCGSNKQAAPPVLRSWRKRGRQHACRQPRCQPVAVVIRETVDVGVRPNSLCQQVMIVNGSHRCSFRSVPIDRPPRHTVAPRCRETRRSASGREERLQLVELVGQLGDVGLRR